ncbi:WecB/TagA/CpsF family glycosyltransferase [Microbacterium sp. GXF7504]
MAVTLDVEHDGRVGFRGAPLFEGTLSDLLDTIDDRVRDGVPRLVVTPNVDQVLNLEDDAAWCEAFDAASVHIADGAPIVALARTLGAPEVHRIAGADLLTAAIVESPARGWRIAILGGNDASLARIPETEHLRTVPLPMLDGPGDPASLPAIEVLRSIRPHLVFICLGSPKQEKWFMAWRHLLPAAVYVGAGGSADFLAGRFARAPRAAQQLGLEWLWRLAQEPRRLAHRYLVKGPRFVGVFLRSLHARGRTAVPGVLPAAGAVSDDR